MRQILLCFFALVALTTLSQRIEIAGVEYSVTSKQRSAKCKAGTMVKNGMITDVYIRSTVKINNTNYNVTEIEDNGFKNCKQVTAIVVPNTVTHIGQCAFWGCTSLKSITLPDEATVEISRGSYGFGKKGVFSGCENLTDVKGTNVRYPKYVLGEAFIECSEVPFYGQITKISQDEIIKQNDIKNETFSEYAKDKIKTQVETWQKKKEYETTAQWRVRVTEETRKTKVAELIVSAQKEYIAKYSPSIMIGEIGTYDADYNIFPIEPNGLNTVYVSVPMEEAPLFKENWHKVKSNPVYGIVDDKLGVLSCVFTLDGKTYNSADTYENDNTQDLALNLSPLELDFVENTTKKEVVKPAIKIDNSIDLNIPSSSTKNTRTFAVIIGNENYQLASKVDFAHNDAVIFGKYCNQTLGVPIKNLRRYKDATYGTFLSAIKDIKDISAAYNGDINVIFYYAGHGIPSESGNESYLLPVDADGTQMAACYSVRELYKELGNLNAKSVVVFLDACFSGAKRGDGMLLATRATAIKPRKASVSGRTIVFSAANGEQTAFPYAEKGHGMFTYFLLEKLRADKGDVTLGELSKYIEENVRQQSVVVNKKLQTPTMLVSPSMQGKWASLKLK